jgi:hypothetical protein
MTQDIGINITNKTATSHNTEYLDFSGIDIRNIHGNIRIINNCHGLL